MQKRNNEIIKTQMSFFGCVTIAFTAAYKIINSVSTE